MQEYKIFKFDTRIPEINVVDFLVNKSFNEEELDDLIFDASESMFNHGLDFEPHIFLEPIEKMLNPMKFVSDSILISGFFDLKIFKIFLSRDNLEKTNFMEITPFIKEKLFILRDYKKESFGVYIKKYLEFNKNTSLEQDNIVELKSKFCHYFKKIMTYDEISIHIIDKFIKDYYYQKNYDKFCYQNNEARYYFSQEIARMKKSLKIVQNFKSIIELKDVKSAENKIYIAFKKGKKYEEITPNNAMWETIEYELLIKVEEVFKIYNAFFDIRKYNHLLIRNSPKMRSEYEKIIDVFDDYNLKTQLLLSFFETKINNYTKGIYHNYESRLSMSIHNTFMKFISSTTKLDFLIMEILFFVGAIHKNTTDETTFLPYNNKKKYDNAADYAADRQNDLDALKKSWLNF